MIKIISLHISKDIELVLGTAIEIVAVLNESNPDSIKISILNPTNLKSVNDVSMTKLSNTVYNYVYQSDANDLDGRYIAVVSATKNSKTSIRQKGFVLVEQEIN